MLPTDLLGARVQIGDAPMPDPVPADAIVRGGQRVRIVATRDVAHLMFVGAGLVRVDCGGRRVTIEPEARVDWGIMGVWLYSLVVAFVGAQQGRFALHANVVAVGDALVAVAGRSGAGKSTTSLGLVCRGARLVADDVAMLEPPGAGVDAIVEPFGRGVHLWPETARALGIDVSGARRVPSNTEKLQLAAPDARLGRLDAVAILSRDDHVEQVEVTPLLGPDAVSVIAANISKRRLLVELWHDEMFAWAGALADRVTVCEVLRPRDGWTLDAVLDEIEDLASRVTVRSARDRQGRSPESFRASA